MPLQLIMNYHESEATSAKCRGSEMINASKGYSKGHLWAVKKYKSSNNNGLLVEGVGVCVVEVM